MEIADATHLATIEGHKAEIFNLISTFNSRSNGLTSKPDLTQLRLDFICELRELLRHHERALRHMRGEPVEPEVQFAQAVLIGVVGGGAAG